MTLAHNADFESIEDTTFRGKLEAQNLSIGSRLIIERLISLIVTHSVNHPRHEGGELMKVEGNIIVPSGSTRLPVVSKLLINAGCHQNLGLQP